ncbi:MAG TPA: hypothetical protein VKJ65_00710, partial [Phycisphaerae bacterium]|nr:hypothetical protein [Phycisphaerae bacterium]
MNVELKDVTLCAADSVYRELTARSLEISGKNCKFADSIFFSHAPLKGSFRSLQIQELKSLEDYTAFVLKELHRHIQ